MSSPPRVAALIASDAISGPGRQLAALAGAFNGTGIRCLIVLLHRRGRAPSPFQRYLETSGLEYRVVEDGGALDFRVAARVQAVLDGWAPSVLQTHGYKAAAIGYVLSRRKHALAWVGFFHGATTENLKDRLYVWLGRRLLCAADQIVVMSEAQAREFRRCGKSVRIIYNAVLNSLRPAGTENPAHGLAHPVIGVVSRLSSEKGVDLLLDACALLARRGIHCSVLIAGDGPERARLEAQAQRLGVDGRVRFLGHVNDVAPLYANVDLVVLPSRSEGLPNTLLEALSADLPVVATSVGAIPEVIGASEAASLVAPGSAAALAGAIDWAVTHGDTAGAAAARREVVRAFSLTRRIDAHVQLYADALSHRATSRLISSS